MNKTFETRIKVVKTYLEGKHSLRELALELKIPYQTIHRWVKWYKKGGDENLRRQQYERHWRRAKDELEKEVMLLKEEKPSLTIRRTKDILALKGTNISLKGIYGIWHRYGFVKKLTKDSTSPFGIATPESEDGIRRAKFLLEKRDIRSAANILNELPSLPEDPILKEIPEKFLSPRRRLERLYLEFGEIPFPQYVRKAKQIRKILERKRYFYSSIIADFFELHALGWIVKPENRIEVLKRLEKKMKGLKDSSLKFLFHRSKASNYYNLLETSKALKHTSNCRRLLHYLPYRYYWENFGDLLTFAGKYKEAFSFYKMAFENEKESKVIDELFLKIALYGYNYSAHYPDCQKMLTKAQVLKNSVKYGSTYHLISGYLSFGNGNLNEASHFFSESLDEAYKGQLHNRIYGAAVGLSSVAMALGKKNEAKIYLQKYLPLMKKYSLLTKELTLKSLINPVKNIKREFKKILPICLLDLLTKAKRTLRITDYRKAFDFAQRKGLLGLFHRWIIFFPEPVLRLLEKGKKTGLPRAVLNFPVFNQKIPVYHIKLLGKLVVTKNQEYLKARLGPKEKAFLIHLALRAGAPRKSVLLKNLYENFWPRSRNPSSLLLHLLVRLKRKLRLSGYLLSISSKSGAPKLVNRGIYITTDYQEFETLFVQINSLERADEWRFARREYMRAFRLFRGEPFRKMYDPWSEHMRRVILNKLETEAIHFAKSCLEHDDEIRQKKRRTPSAKCRGGNMADAKKVLEKVTKIIPQSEESAKILQTL